MAASPGAHCMGRVCMTARCRDRSRNARGTRIVPTGERDGLDQWRADAARFAGTRGRGSRRRTSRCSTRDLISGIATIGNLEWQSGVSDLCSRSTACPRRAERLARRDCVATAARQIVAVRSRIDRGIDRESIANRAAASRRRTVDGIHSLHRARHCRESMQWRRWGDLIMRHCHVWSGQPPLARS